VADMRVESRVVSLSWIPADSVAAWLRNGLDGGLAHYAEPPLAALPGLDAVQQLRADDRFRFANVLTAWAEFDDDGTPTACGYGPDSGGVVGPTTVRLASVGATFGGYALPTLQQDPILEPGLAHVTQTVGGRTGVPLPRALPHAPFVLWQAPIVWTTLALTLRPDGTAEVAMPGASAFPRHWVYGPDGALLQGTGLTDEEGWMTHAFAGRTPWGDQDSDGVVAETERAVERQLAAGLLHPGRSLEVRRLPAGAVVAREGEPGEEIFFVLDGVLAVEHDGTPVAQLGTGAVLGEQAVLESSARPSTLLALTPVRLAVARGDALDLEKLRAVAEVSGRRAGAPAPAAD
ncbi:cyclic nucleotide-binding domain-containing protein, partial [Georgenia ruanii]|nr:cyclic nucleotide-binding domain-containing protein [Georgenia ruanii]